MRTPVIATAAALLALGLAACSTPGPTDAPAGAATAAVTQPPAATAAASSAPADSGKAALEAAVRAYSTAYLSGHGAAAYALLSKRCTTSITKAQLTAVAQAAADVYGNVDIKTLSVDQLSGDLARVTYTYPVTKLNQAGQPWARENGAWHYDAC